MVVSRSNIASGLTMQDVMLLEYNVAPGPPGIPAWEQVATPFSLLLARLGSLPAVV